MVELFQALKDYMWIMPLAIVQISLMGIALWQWVKNHNNLGSKKIIWLFMIIFLNFFGPMTFFAYLQKLNISNPENKDLYNWGA